MKHLILFDVDGTLVSCPPDTAPVAAIRDLYGLEISLEGIRTGGMTEPQILALLLRSGGWDDVKITKKLPRLMQAMEFFCRQAFNKGTAKLLPGVKSLLTELKQRGVILGLVTGNRRSLAQLKLEDVDIWSYFSIGGFGDDPHEKRSDLIRLAVDRAGFGLNGPGIYVVGDTWRDMKAAVEAGVVNRVGLVGPRHPRQEFEEAGATIILSSFTDTPKVLGALNIPLA